MLEVIRNETNAAVVTLKLNRPDKLNSLTSEMKTDLLRTFDEIKKDNITRCVILTGTGRAFCTGEDVSSLNQVLTSPGETTFGELLKTYYNPLILQMRALPVPIIASINGIAAGSGVSLALACDIRIAAEEASFSQAFSLIGLVPDSGASFFLPRIIGSAKAMELFLTGNKLSAKEAFELGMVNFLTPGADLEATTLELANKLANGPTKTYGFIKSLVNNSFNSTLAEALEHEASLQDLAGLTEDAREGITAFLGKKRPQFKGV